VATGPAAGQAQPERTAERPLPDRAQARVRRLAHRPAGRQDALLPRALRLLGLTVSARSNARIAVVKDVVIDSAAVLCAFLMAARMKHAITPSAMRVGMMGAVLHTAGQRALPRTLGAARARRVPCRPEVRAERPPRQGRLGHGPGADLRVSLRLGRSLRRATL
jgi:hypothetical protein